MKVNYKGHEAEGDEDDEDEGANDETPHGLHILGLRHDANAREGLDCCTLDIGIFGWTILVLAHYSNDGDFGCVLGILEHVYSRVVEDEAEGSDNFRAFFYSVFQL